MKKYTTCEHCGKIYQTRMKRNHICNAPQKRKALETSRKQFYKENPLQKETV